jgi:site-specific DNA recombinase
MDHPEAKRMLVDIKGGKITGLIFSKLARLARNTRQLLDFADHFNLYGADLISLQEAIDTSTPAGRLFYTVIAAMSQWEREEIASRVQASVPIRAKLGKSLGGQAPFGYAWNGKELVVDPAESPIRKLMYELYIRHKRRKTVASELNKMGYRTRNGSHFSDTTVERLLRDPMAKGIRRANYTKSTGDGKHWVNKAPEDWVLTACPAIVSEELWQAANTLLDQSKASRNLRGRISAHLFTGLLTCTCGAKMYIAPRMTNYRCRECKKTQIPKEDIEEIYFEQLKGFLLTREDLATFQSLGQETIKSKEDEKLLLEKERSKVKTDMDKLVELHLKGSIPTKGFKGYYDPLDLRINQIDETLSELDGQIDFTRVQVLNGEYILSNAENLYEKWPTMLRDEKRKVIEDLTQSIVIGDQEITIRFLYAPDLLQNEQNRQRTPRDSCWR